MQNTFQGWTLTEACAHTTDPSLWDAMLRAKKELNAESEPPWRVARSAAFFEQAIDGCLVIQGCRGSINAAPMIYRAAACQYLGWLDWSTWQSGKWKSELVETASEQVRIYDVRVFPALLAPNAAEVIAGRAAGASFWRFVIGDPEVQALGKRVVAGDLRHRDVFEKRRFPALPISYKWPLNITVDELAHKFTRDPSLIKDSGPATPAIRAVCKVIVDRIEAWKGLLCRGEVVATGTDVATDNVGAVSKAHWLRRGISIDIQHSDFFDGGHKEPRWTGSMLSVAASTAAVPAIESQEQALFGKLVDCGAGSAAYATPLPAHAGRAEPTARKVRGPRSLIRDRVKERMKHDINKGRITKDQLVAAREKSLAHEYQASRDTCRKARESVLSELSSNICDK
jgi:hypothetical protein